MKSQVVMFICCTLMDFLLMAEGGRLPLEPSIQGQLPSDRANDLNTAPTTNMFERYSSSSFGGLFPSPYWNGNRNNYNSWPYPAYPGYQPNYNYNQPNPYNPEPYNPYSPYNYFGGSYGGGSYGSSSPIGIIGAAKPGTSKSART